MRLRSMGARRALVASALLTLAALTVVAGGSAARTPEASGAEGIIDAQWTPVGLRDATDHRRPPDGRQPGHGRRGRRRARAQHGREVRDQGRSEGQAERAHAARSRRSAARSSPTTRSRTTASRCGSTASKVDSLEALPGVIGVRGRSRRQPDNDEGRPADRRARPVAACRPARREHQDRRDRHRHRLHARQLRRPGHRRGLQRRARRRHAAADPASFGWGPASRAASTWSATTTTPTRTTRPTSRFRIRIRTRSTATGTARTSPAPPRARA